jgi:molybdate transport system substrate-binding protein
MTFKGYILHYYFGLILVVGFTLSSCQSKTSVLTIAVASNLQYVIEDLTDEFSAQYSVKCNWVTGSSGKLTAQLKEGAPFDVFLSADSTYPLFLIENKLAHSLSTFAFGKLVLWSSQSPFPNLEETSAVAIANPKSAPYGIAARQSLDYIEVEESKLVFGESVAQVNQFVLSGAVDFGFTSKSSVLAAQTQGKGSWVLVDPNFYSPIAQTAVALKHRPALSESAMQFIDFLSSKKAEEILLANGYSLAD